MSLLNHRTDAVFPKITRVAASLPQHQLSTLNSQQTNKWCRVVTMLAAICVWLNINADAATLYWGGTSAQSWTATTGTRWGTSDSPYATTWVNGSDAVFNVALSTITGASVNVVSITANENVTVSPSGTFSVTGNGIAIITVASGKTLDFGSQSFTTSATAGFTKAGSGTLNLAGGTYGGGFTLSAGTVGIGGVNALGAGGALTINGGILQSTASSRALSGKYTSITIGGDFAFGGSGALTFDAATALGGAVRTITQNDSATITLNGIISGASGNGLTKAGNGTLALGAANTYNGNTTISAGTLALINSGSIANSLNIIISSSATFDVSTLTAALTLANGQKFIANGATASATNLIAFGKGLTIGSGGLVFTNFNGIIPPLAIAGAGSNILSSGDSVTVYTTSTLPAGDYTLITNGIGNTTAVTGTAPTTLGTVLGSGVSGSASLVISSGRLVLHVVSVGNAAPIVTTQPATSPSTSGATLNGTVTSDGGAPPLTDRGFYWSTSPNPQTSGTQLPVGGTAVAAFSTALGSLSVNTIYYYRAYAVNSVGTGIGASDVSFYTAANTPTAPTVGNPQSTSLDVTIGSGDGNPAITTYAIKEAGGQFVQGNGALGASAVFQTAAIWGTKTVTGLIPSTGYSFTVEARNGDGSATTSFGSPGAGTTSVGVVAPSVTTQAATSTNTTGATLNGTVTADGGGAITDRGFYWTNTPGVTTSGTKFSEGGTSLTTFSKALAGLSPNTNIFYRAYAVNSSGTGIGSSDVSFYTLANTPSAPTVNGPTPNSLNVSITSGDGNPANTVYAIQETTSGNYVQVSGIGGLGAAPIYKTAATWATTLVTNLIANTTYTFAVVATNGAGIATSFSSTTSGTTQTPPLAGWYGPWSSSAAPSPFDALFINANLSSAQLARVGLTASGNSTRYSSSAWNNNTANYLTATLTASGYAINLNGAALTGNWGSSSTGPASFDVRSSVDNYASSLGTISSSAATAYTSLVLPASGYNGLSSITFKFIGSATAINGSATGSGGTGGPANFYVSGSVQERPIISGVTPSQSINYGTANVTLSGTVSASGPIYPADGETVSVTINGSTQPATISGGAGGFSVSFPTAAIPLSSTPYTITYAYAGDANLPAATNNISTTLSVGISVPNLTYTIATNVSLAITLADIQAAGLASAQATPNYSITGVNSPTAAAGTVIFNASNIKYTNSVPITIPDSFSYTVTDGTASGSGLITVNFTYVTGPQIIPSGTDGNGNPVLSFRGLPGYTYHFQRATTLTPTPDWMTQQPGVTVPSNGDGSATWTDSNVPIPNPVYYRLSYP